WPEADGKPRKERLKKAVPVGGGDEAKVEPKTWKLQAPAAGGRAPVAVVFPKPLDHALLHRMLWIEDEKGRKVPGAVQVDSEEKRWRFTPAGAWTAGKYQLVADKRLEDLAGNNLARPFEVD